MFYKWIRKHIHTYNLHIYMEYVYLFSVISVLAGYQKPNVKTLRYPFSAEFWRHCMLSGGIQRRASTPERSNPDFSSVN